MISDVHLFVIYDVKYRDFSMYSGFTFVNRKMQILLLKETIPEATSEVVEIFTFFYFALMKINFYIKSWHSVL